MESTADNRSPTRATRSNLAAALSDLERVMHWDTTDAGSKSLSYETVLLEPAAKTVKEVDPSFMKRMLATSTINRATEDMTGTVIDSDSDTFEYKQLQLPKSFVKPLSDTRSDILRVLANLGVVMKTDVEAIVKTRLANWTCTLQAYIVKNGDLKLYDEL